MTEINNSGRFERGAIDDGAIALADRGGDRANYRAGLTGARDWAPDSIEQIRRRVGRLQAAALRDVAYQAPSRPVVDAEARLWNPAIEDQSEDAERWDGMG